jgi:predicted metal-binding protein
MVDQNALESLFAKYGFVDFKWISPKDIIVAQWVRMKCIFGCPNYGKNACCPPGNVPSIPECRAFFQEYGAGVIFHIAKYFDSPQDRHAWSRDLCKSFSALEREVFLSGYHKAFLLPFGTCSICENCNKVRHQCVNAETARPTPDALGIDVYGTVRQYGFPINVLPDYAQTMNRYTFLLVD